MTNTKRGRYDKLLDGPGEPFFESNYSEFRAMTWDEGDRKSIARFFVATEKAADSRRGSGPITTQSPIARVEKYLDANLTTAVSRSDLADIAGVSIRTLSRFFLARHGVGPMGFFRARRLDAAYRCLIAAEADSTKVTDVAVRYGFNHLGKFAMEYKKTFGESPSITLKRRRLTGLGTQEDSVRRLPGFVYEPAKSLPDDAPDAPVPESPHGATRSPVNRRGSLRTMPS